jgi:hypothetical protein
MAEPYYATAVELRSALGGLSEEVLPDADATKLIVEAEDLVDERLANRPIDTDTGRKVKLADYDGDDAWRLRKLAEATLEVASVIFADPDVARRQRVRSTSGDVSTSSPYGPAYGERAQALLNASGLAIPFATVGRRRSRAGWVADRFFGNRP